MADGDLRREFRRHLPTVDFATVEVSRSRGIPDANYCVRACEGWIEFKAAVGRRVIIRPEQVGWIERRLRAGGTVLIAVRKGDRLIVYSGDKVRLLKTSRITDVEHLGSWGGGPARWDWDAVLALMAPEDLRRSPSGGR